MAFDLILTTDSTAGRQESKALGRPTLPQQQAGNVNKEAGLQRAPGRAGGLVHHRPHSGVRERGVGGNPADGCHTVSKG